MFTSVYLSSHRYYIYVIACLFLSTCPVTDIIYVSSHVYFCLPVQSQIGGRVFQQTVIIPIGTNCAPLLADLFLYLQEADFIQGLLNKNKKKLALSFNLTFHYINDVLLLNNCNLVTFFIASTAVEIGTGLMDHNR